MVNTKHIYLRENLKAFSVDSMLVAFTNATINFGRVSNGKDSSKSQVIDYIIEELIVWKETLIQIDWLKSNHQEVKLQRYRYQ